MLLLLVRSYQLLLSPYMGGNCRFEPSCSHYAQEALEKRPATTAIQLIMTRLLRCRPFGAHGYDPIPEVK